MKLLEGKTAIVTGGTRGIGKAIALYFAREGCNIAFTDLFEDEHMKQTEAEISALGVKAKGYASDASKYDDTQRVVSLIAADFGKVDVLVNNAGITKDGALKRMTEEQWDLEKVSCY
ncbi:MAG TPA: SDR family NAD(P)-dependent oxidoreductase [Prolixibacteraceae bacterium]|nr:SDR family NAD(P)-dependent oxidoreductase [Prolixibacteraceae bacterium]